MFYQQIFNVFTVSFVILNFLVFTVQDFRLKLAAQLQLSMYK